MGETTQLDLQHLHDLLLVSKPSEASHEASLCPLCVASDDGTDPHESDDTLGGDVTTYTEDDLKQAVADAVAPIQARLDALTEEQGQAEFESRLAEMTEAHEAKVAELQSEIDTAKAAAEAAEGQYAELVGLIEEAKAAEAEAEALATRKEEIKEAVASLFSEDHVEANLDRWAALEVEAFESSLDDWTAAAAAVKASAAKVGETAPAATAMQKTAEVEGERTIAQIRQDLQTRGNVVRTVGASYTGGNA